MPPSIETARLRLRPFTLDDAEAHHQAVYGDAEAMRYMPGGAPRTLPQTEKVISYFIDHWEQHGYGAWAVEELESGDFIGQCGLNIIFDTSPPQTEILYAFARSAWGQGYATEAAQASLIYAFEEIELPRVLALAEQENAPSLRVMEKLGMKYLGIKKYYNAKLAAYEMLRINFKRGDGPFTLIP